MKKTAVPSVLGQISPDVFMRQYWQKKPLLIRQAVPDMKPLLSRQALLALAALPDVESRLVTGDIKTRAWTFRHGPFKPRSLPPFSQPHWTLLVQSVDLHDAQVAALRDRFRFVPDARLDDVMISYATDGGGVGPHFDSYDVFLLQAQGKRRWRISPQKDLRLREDVPLKILKAFKPTETFVLEAGDMLYLPPHYAHEGVAVGECMTYSIGFKAESPESLARELLMRLADMEPEATSSLYKDPRQIATKHPALIPLALQSFAQTAVQQALKRQSDVRCALGEFLSEPKSSVWFEAQPLPHRLGAVRLDNKSKMLYDKDFIFMNGESWRCKGSDARCLRYLADRRSLDRHQTANASVEVQHLLMNWIGSGWIHPLG
jgi:50S ribosomal protein L16 3-hydroxylase